MTDKENKMPKRSKEQDGSMKDCEMTEFKITSPVGIWDVYICQEGLHFVKLERDKFSEINEEIPVECIPKEESLANSDVFLWMKCFFERASEIPLMNLPAICPSLFAKDAFRQRAWKYIYHNVGFGVTKSYGEIASGMGTPGAAQAVGSAMRTNPVSLIIPCHRVIRSGGKAGHYSGGTRDNLKVWLIEHEKKYSTSADKKSKPLLNYFSRNTKKYNST
eukprot:TRINITY_DN22815_c0_g1_i3.p1 TRINITY_DN22815_c0_g1~~TRINITY_DN22815_c0_g1_i3.p1  ORF type:complete len:219 (-),score=23.03 TRINITY_DN22815_c0_g1_i3:618-1274(-)